MRFIRDPSVAEFVRGSVGSRIANKVNNIKTRRRGKLQIKRFDLELFDDGTFELNISLPVSDDLHKRYKVALLAGKCNESEKLAYRIVAEHEYRLSGKITHLKSAVIQPRICVD